MNLPLYIVRFLHRIRYQMVFGSLIVTALVFYFSQFIQKKYTVTTSIYTGIASTSGLEEDNKLSFFELNSTFDNLINLTKAKGTLEKVSIRLFALNMINGDLEKDNLYITARNYKELLKIVPEEVLKLIDKSSLNNTVENLYKYKKEEPGNFLFGLFNWNHPHYSYNALKAVLVKRINSSDLIEISFNSADPGITMNTVKLITEELIQSYDGIRYKSANDVVKYYEKELTVLRSKLDKMENSLTDYNIENKVINFSEQTKAIAIAYTSYEDRYEAALREYESSLRLIAQLEGQMDTRSKLFLTNTEFIKALDQVSTINGKITEIETFSPTNVLDNNTELQGYKKNMDETEKEIEKLSNEINEYKYSKEGVAIESMVDRWLNEKIRNTKAKAELDILDKRKKEFAEQYKTYSPIGTQINRKEREIRITEESYLEVLHGLNLAKLKQKNIQLTSATLNVITPATFPLISDGSKRGILSFGAFIGSLIFIIGCNLVIELLDRTLRDAERTQRITNTPVLGAFTGNMQLRFRGYRKACNRISANYTCNKLNDKLESGKTMIVNLLSIESKEGKTFIGNYMKEEWEEQGITVKYLIAGKDFDIDASYLLTNGFNRFLNDSSKPHILLIEYPAIIKGNLPSSLISQASYNIIITNACRVWKNSDEVFLNNLKERSGSVPLYIYLNNATREAVEDFTGLLPPYSSMRSLSNRLLYLGLTTRNTAVK